MRSRFPVRVLQSGHFIDSAFPSLFSHFGLEPPPRCAYTELLRLLVHLFLLLSLCSFMPGATGSKTSGSARRSTCASCTRKARGESSGAPAAKHEFQHQLPCPSTDRVTGACPGYVIDHVIALACGGVDGPANVQWQTRAESRAKDRIERRTCRG